MQLSRRIAVLGLIALAGMGIVACGDDDDEGAGASTGGSGEAVAPPPNEVFSNFSTALEAQGLVVTKLPPGSLDGAEAGVEISGDRSGSARSFATSTRANDYAGTVKGEQTNIVGTVVIQAGSSDDVAFFTDAYED